MSVEVTKRPTLTIDATFPENMMEYALNFSAQKVGYADRDQVLADIQSGNCSTCESVRYGLAQKIADYLGTVDDTVKAVYIYEPEYATTVDGAVPDDLSLSKGIHMIAWVVRKTAALSSLIDALGSSLTQEVKRFDCPKANALCYKLVVHIVDDEEVLTRTGYGALVDSFYVRPIEIWRRS
ncbi:MAG: hypothetical protein H5T63_06095 [Chloroflexi bacterium]|nr:hypothetical protein [Chloroflexota bacterium]